MNERRYYSEDAKMRAKRDMSLLAVLALSLGLGIGTVLALLFAPKEGEEIRDDMTSMMEKRMRMVESQLSDLRANLEDRVASLS